MKDGSAAFPSAGLCINKVEYDAWMEMPQEQNKALCLISQVNADRLMTFVLEDTLPYGVQAIEAY